MAAQKRPLDDASSNRKTKKSRSAEKPKAKETKPDKPSALAAEEVDFPRGGGTSFTPLEVKAIRAEAVKEADEALFKEAQDEKSKKKSKKSTNKEGGKSAEKGEFVRIEHLNYKRVFVGMKILGQIVSIIPLGLIISLPNQLYGHIPITQISYQFTSILERFDAQVDDTNAEDSDNEDEKSRLPDLFEMFHVGQYVRTVVTDVHVAGVSDMSGLGKLRDDLAKASKRVELSLVPEKTNAGVQKTDLKNGFALSVAIKSIEDHGYSLDLGVPDVSGFLSFESLDSKLFIGQVVDVSVTKVSSNGRVCRVSLDNEKLSTAFLSEISSVNSVLPGTLVQCLVTSINPDGINLQVLGFFDGTVDLFHLSPNPEKSFRVGKKIKARILYNYSTSPPKFALALSDHVLCLRPKRTSSDEGAGLLQDTYPIGTVLDAVEVLRVEKERGLIVEVGKYQEGFVHISHLSDDHVPSLTLTGSWKPGTIHRARVTGYFAFDGLLQLSLKPSVLEQKYIQVTDVEVGEVVKGTIKKLTDSALFITLGGNIDGVVWPNHYADIRLKHPAKRFKVGATIKCRVLVVDPERKRISLTAKKTLLDSQLPILSSLEQVQLGIVVHAVVFKVHDKHLLIEFYNNLKAVVPMKEASETPVTSLAETFPIGRAVKVRIITVDQEQGRIIASIRQASSTFDSAVTDFGEVEVGNIVEGAVTEIHKDNAILLLQPTRVRALLSLKNLANHRNISLPQLKTELKVDEKLTDLVVVTRNQEKGFVIVANAPKTKAALPSRKSLSIETINVGQIVGGRVTRHTRHGTLVKITSHIGGVIHPTDISDNFDSGNPFPVIDTLVKAAVVDVDREKRQVTLSTRQSRLHPDKPTQAVDKEINTVSDLTVGDTVRGFIKSVAEHGLFVTIGRGVDARVQIRELFDDFVKDWKPRFRTNQLVKGHILSVDQDNGKIELTFRSGDLSSRQRETAKKRSPSDFHESDKVDGVVKRIEEYGLFIQIEGTKLSGLCHKSELSDNKDADVSVALQNFREGDKVKAVVIAVDKKRISLSLKPSHFSQEELAEEDESDESGYDGDDRVSSPFGVVDADMMDDGEEDRHAEIHSAEEDSHGEDEDDAMEVDEGVTTQLFQRQGKQGNIVGDSNTPAPVLSFGSGFKWHGLDEPEEAVDSEDGFSDSDDGSDGESQSHKKKKKKRKEIEQDLTAELQTKTPESNADFERVLLGSPNSSYVWIQYMSFQLQLSEIDKAREIGKRAIKTINFREEQERMNVWIALLNLENVYGTDESLDATFKDAARANDSKTIHLRLASILEQSSKHDKAVEQYQKTCKKFGASSKVWTLFAESYLKSDHVEEARKLLPRSFQSLEKRKHIKTASKFAQLEYKHGDLERGKTIFEGIVDSHPKRWDIWSIYIDMEAGQQNIQSIRNLFDRVLTLKMTSHKAKSFFKKWLELERRIGDEEGADTVKQKAIEWTQKAAGNAS
ncbi:rRNA biogenesis protein RRP5 [Leucoagaricus sp. SymC.cos]|nr:rRNA biogenesis protein RRP5 [Leucoagaricus sp. SymC.cos]